MFIQVFERKRPRPCWYVQACPSTQLGSIFDQQAQFSTAKHDASNPSKRLEAWDPVEPGEALGPLHLATKTIQSRTIYS